ncbi:hypothetical protein [uncultured Secundilactobacillus sp.]|uniref:hypothetical protein n=1 Tax=uncultured Secundilactobacillus sp. TaxID=2813935 RepID=UPI00258A0A98|nr:hypothetical protein [uncultured Secundilactobacillus sp.]
MKLTKIITTIIAAGTLAITTTEVTASASSWHYGALPAKIRGKWHASHDYNQKLKITKYFVKYTGESASYNLRWKYNGHGFYRLDFGDDFAYYLHYFNSHKISTNSFWHTYIK